MSSLHYLRLIGYTAGTLLHLFLLVIIVGYRRPRAFERVLFFVVLAQFFFFSGALLQVNAELYYATPPAATLLFAAALMVVGLGLLPPLLVHLHVEHQRARTDGHWNLAQVLLVVAMYLPLTYFGWRIFPVLISDPLRLALPPDAPWAVLCRIWAALAFVLCALAQLRISKLATTPRGRRFYTTLAIWFALLSVAVAGGFPGALLPGAGTTPLGLLAALVLSLFPSAAVGYTVVRFNWLQLGRQRNLIYAVSATFLALLYLAVVRRVSNWLDPALPPEATVSILLFVLVFLFEPLQRRVSRALRRTLREEVDRLQRILGEIQQETRRGEVRHLIDFIERRIAKEFELLQVRVVIGEGGLHPAGPSEHMHRFSLGSGRKSQGWLEVYYASGMLSGETYAALEFLAEQLPGLIDLCRLMEEKLALERELAERERLALVGQMAASISHNLKNPLGSMKTLLQVQLEDPALPAGLRRDCQMVVAEIDCLSAKLGQLLQYAKPAVRAGGGGGRVEAVALAQQVVNLLRHEAERRHVALTLEIAAPHQGDAGTAYLCGSEEALNDILSNLIVNAIEALSAGGKVRVGLCRDTAVLRLSVTDNGPGIAPEIREKIFQPFFTSKPSGTGLGLAIVERRVAELGGEIHWQSPLAEGPGTQFTVELPLAPDAPRTENSEGER